MINGRISDRSINSYNRIKFLLKGLFKYIDIFIMQTEQDKKRIISLGAESNRVYNYGNLKFNIELPIFDRLELEKLKEKLEIDGERVFVAGSTRDDEEEYILEAFDKLENTILILVPRHIERTDDICRRLLDGKYHYERWSKIEESLGVIHELPKRQIIIVDKIGELRKLYAICDVAYVGGTLVNIGGHSLLEPLFYRKPPIFGPYLQNVRNIAKEVLAREIGFQVNDSEELYEILSKYDFLINNHKENEKNMIERIEQFFEENSHVVELTFEKIKY
jgi:3-deoxy-D-manno-octulosonic-acid transferase